MSNCSNVMETRKLRLPPPGRTFIAGAILALLVFAHTAGLSERNYNVSTTSFIDPAGVIQVTAWDLFNESRFEEGAFPLWNPYTGLGQPHLGSMQPAPFYPLKILFYAIGGLEGHDFYLMARLWLMGFGAFLLLYCLGAGFGGSLFGAITYGFGGYSLWFINLVDLNNQLLTPFLMVSFGLLVEKWTPRRFAMACILIAADMAGGHPEALFVSLLFSGTFAIFWAGRRQFLHAAGKLAAAGVSGCIAAGAVLLPVAQYYPKAWHFHFKGMGFVHIWPKALITVFSPVFRPLAAGREWALPPAINLFSLFDIYRLPYDMLLMKAGFPYLGFIGAAFTLWGIVRLRKLPRSGVFFLIFFLLAAGLAMGLFPFNLISFLPPFNVMNNAKFFFCEIALSLCVLAGLAAGDFMKNRREAGAILIVALVVELAASSLTVAPYVPVEWKNAMKAEWAEEIDLSMKGYRFQAGGYFLFPPNFGVVKGFSDIRSSDALYPEDYFYRLYEMGGTERKYAIYDFYPRYFTRLNRRALENPETRLMSLKYYVTERQPFEPLDNFELISSNGYYLYSRPDACPRVFTSSDISLNCEAEPDWERPGPESVRIRLDGNWPLVVFSELDYPGWKAEFNGTTIKPLERYTPMQVYDVGERKGELTIRYEPEGFKAGLWSSLAGCAFLLALVFVRRKGGE